MTNDGPVMVTGAAGFVGSALVHELLRRGREVLAVVRRGGRPLPLAHRRVTEVAVELPDLGGIAHCPAPRVIYHAAAVVDPRCCADPAQCQQVIVEGSTALGRWARERGSRLVMVSSMAAMGLYHAPEGVDERSPCRPLTPYGGAKYAAERQLTALSEKGLSLTVVRPPTLYGPEDRYNFLALARAIARRAFVLFGGGANRFGVMHVDNLVAALLTVGEQGCEGLFLAEDGEEATLAQVAGAISRALGRTARLPSLPRWTGRACAATVESLCGVVGTRPPLSRARLRTLTTSFGARIDRLQAAGYRQRLPMERGIQTTIAAFRRRGVL